MVIGGPDATSSPQVYTSADFLVLGEAEGIIDTFIEAWRPLIPRKNVSQGNLVGPGVLLFG